MADDDKPESSDDPWAGLEAEPLPDLAGDFSFSFDDAPAADAEKGGGLAVGDAAAAYSTGLGLLSPAK